MTILTNPTSSHKTDNLKAPLDLEEAVRHRAYEYYQERGYVDGHDVEDWLLAEEEINGKLLTTPFSGA